jgi:uncharacterized membrane protein YccF (DUF307 family)
VRPLLNVIWLVFGGLWLALEHLTGVLMCLTSSGFRSGWPTSS